MTDEELAAAAAALVGGTASVAYATVVVDVAPADWVRAVTAVRDDPDLACTFFDLLTVVDEQERGLAVQCRLWSVAHRHGLLLRTLVPADQPALESLVGVFAGAAWAEREAYEMFGLVFAGHPDLRPLLLPEAFEGHPLRKDFVLASRAAQPWPGAVDPADRPGRARRRRLVPPGEPGPGSWEDA